MQEFITPSLLALMASPLLLAVLLAALSLLLEDGALVLGALAVQHDQTLMTPVFIGLFGGIVVGDLALYGLGRLLGKNRRVGAWLDQDRISMRAQQLRQRLWPAITLSRALPASRLPTFTAAGMLRVSFCAFALVVTLTALLWVYGALFLGAEVLGYLAVVLGVPAWLVVGVLLLLVLTPVLFLGRKDSYARP